MIIGAISALLGATYLFRGHVFGYNDRISVVGIKEEKKDSLDVIYIGGSAAFVYWELMKAYKDCGFTSYDLATNSIQTENILAWKLAYKLIEEGFKVKRLFVAACCPPEIRPEFIENIRDDADIKSC